MPYKDPEKAKEVRRLSKRKTRGYKRGARAEEFLAKYPEADLSTLTPQEREAIERYYLQGEALARIATDWGFSREWVRLVIKDAVKKLSSIT